jgi:hypothetical protein
MTIAKRLSACFGAAAALLLIAGTARADRPLVSETADVIGAGDCQIESALAQSRTRGSPSMRLAEVFGSCGVAGHSQLGIALGSTRQAGSTDLGIGLAGKTTLKMPTEGATGWGLAYGLGLEKAAGEGWRHGSSRLLGVATRELRPGLLGHVNLGWSRSQRDRQSTTTWSLGVEGDHALRWAADLYGDDRGRPWASAGLLFPLADKLSANLAYAQQFERPRVRLWTLGLKVEL